MTTRFSNSAAAAQRARNAHNASVTNSKPPVQRGNVPNPADKPLVLPAVRETQPKPAYGPGTKRSGGK
jgi:hypothetical protein